MKQQILFYFVLILFFSCKNIKVQVEPDYYNLPTETEKGINVVVEIPAGTNHKIEYNPKTKTFENDKIDGKIRIIKFLPYIGNYGFIPSTYMDPKRGGDGDALDILVIGESQASKTVIEVLPIGVLLLKDKGELDSKIIAIPSDTKHQVIAVKSFQEFLVKYDAAKRMIEDWFLNYKGDGEMELIGWRDEQYARQEVEKWKVKKMKSSID